MVDCNHQLGYQRQFETEHFFMVVTRCHVCGEFLGIKTTSKPNVPEIPKKDL